MTVSDNRQTIDAWCRRVWGERDERAIFELFAAQGTAGGMGRAKLAGPDEFLLFHRALCGLLTDTSLRIDHALESGDEMCALATFSGRCAATGSAVEIEGSMTITFAGGKLLHCANHFEFMTLFEQLGLLPQDSFGLLMQGQKLAATGAG